MKTILFLLLLGAGGYIYYQHGQLVQLNIKLTNLQSVYSSTPQSGPTVSMGDHVTADTWKNVASASIIAAVGVTDEESGTVIFSNAVDLTGDTIPEGIFEIGSGIAGNWFSIFKFDTNKNINALKVKNKDGAISTTKLVQAISATKSTSYKLLPEEHGYYLTETVNTSTIATPKLSCTVTAYSWNVLTGEFEFSQTLTDKYKPEVCK